MTAHRRPLTGVLATGLATAAVLAFASGPALANHEPGRGGPDRHSAPTGHGAPSRHSAPTGPGERACPPQSGQDATKGTAKGKGVLKGHVCPPPVVDDASGKTVPPVRAGQGSMD